VAGTADLLGWGLLRAVAARPALWHTALRQLAELCPRRWWAKWPPLPLPDPGYLVFRLETLYGDHNRALEVADLLAYLEWCRRMGALAR
jgi:hypothetical protein